ncbi:MAG: hypothetical protein R3B54_04265 [Bdellovibrionota bacterium]
MRAFSWMLLGLGCLLALVARAETVPAPAPAEAKAAVNAKPNVTAPANAIADPKPNQPAVVLVPNEPAPFTEPAVMPPAAIALEERWDKSSNFRNLDPLLTNRRKKSRLVARLCLWNAGCRLLSKTNRPKNTSSISESLTMPPSAMSSMSLEMSPSSTLQSVNPWNSFPSKSAKFRSPSPAKARA